MMSTRTTQTTKHQPTASRPIADHLSELRWRLAVVALVFVVASSFAYSVREWLIHVVMSPIGQQKLVYLTPAGGFSFIFSVTLYAGLIATAPVLIYHVYRFIAPALPDRARRYSLRVIVASILLLAAGVGFGYFVAIPAALRFLTTFAGAFVEANLTADSYLSFVVAYLLGLGVMFQLPLLLLFWNWVAPFQKGGLLATQQYVLIGAFIAAAMITPTPDVLNQTLIALPIILVYQLGVVAVYVINRSAHKNDTTARSAVQDSFIRGGASKPDYPEVVAVHDTQSVQRQPGTTVSPSPMRARSFDVVAPRTHASSMGHPRRRQPHRGAATRSIDGIRGPQLSPGSKKT